MLILNMSFKVLRYLNQSLTVVRFLLVFLHIVYQEYKKHHLWHQLLKSVFPDCKNLVHVQYGKENYKKINLVSISVL